MEINIDKELEMMRAEKAQHEVALQGYQNKMAEALRGAMGQDIKDAFEGKSQPTIPFKKKWGFKIKCFFLKIFKAI